MFNMLTLAVSRNMFTVLEAPIPKKSGLVKKKNSLVKHTFPHAPWNCGSRSYVFRCRSFLFRALGDGARTDDPAAVRSDLSPVSAPAYTQLAIQDSDLFGPNPWIFLAQIVKLCVITYQKKSAWATQPLEQILDSEFLLCELGVMGT